MARVLTQFNSDGAVPSLRDAVRRHASNLPVVDAQQLPSWLPALAHPPAGWVIGQLDPGVGPTRIVLRRNLSDDSWDCCAILNLYAFTGSVPSEVIEAETASTLRAISANFRGSWLVAVPARDGLHVDAASAAGEFLLGGRKLHGQYTAYLVQTEHAAASNHHNAAPVRGALIEHNIFSAVHTDTRTRRELTDMDDAVLTALRRAVE